jgi:hypothetical protein
MTMAETHSLGEYKALLRTDFASFARHCFHELNPRTPFALSWHHECILRQRPRFEDVVQNVPARRVGGELISTRLRRR